LQTLLTLSTGDFDVTKRKCLNKFFWFFLDKVRYFLTTFSTLVASHKVVFALSDASRCVFEKSFSTNFAKYIESSSVFKILKKSLFLN
jgi:hypothetical protein